MSERTTLTASPAMRARLGLVEVEAPTRRPSKPWSAGVAPGRQAGQSDRRSISNRIRCAPPSSAGIGRGRAGRAGAPG